MLVEKNRTEALKAFKKGRTVKVITQYENSEILEDMNDLIPEKGTHYLVDVPGYADPEFDNQFSGTVKKANCTGCIHKGNREFCLNCFRGGVRDYYLQEAHPVVTNADKFIKVFGDIDLLTDGVDIRRPCSWWREEYKGTDDTAKFQNDEQGRNENPMDKITAEAMELLCDKYCKYSDTIKDQEELEQICDKCRVGKLIGIDAVNEYNRVAIETMQKQIPKKPNYEDDEYICPSCNTHYEICYDEYTYCPHCGQKLDFNDD